MSIKRLVVVVDDYDLEILAKALISVGVSAQHIHVSSDHDSAELRKLGIKADVRPGRLLVKDVPKIDQASLLGIP